MEDDKVVNMIMEIKNDIAALRADFTSFRAENTANDVYLDKRVSSIEDGFSKFKEEYRQKEESRLKEYKDLVNKVIWLAIAGVLTFGGSVVVQAFMK